VTGDRQQRRTTPRAAIGEALHSSSSLDGELESAVLLPVHSRPTPEPLSRLTIALAALPVTVLVVMGYQRRWVTEDAFISLRVVDQILAGNGPIFNTGERVEAYTHPLWVALLALWELAGLPATYGAVILGILCSAGGLVAAEAASLRLVRQFRQQRAVARQAVVIPLGALVFVALPVVWDFVTSGLESGLGFGWLGLSYLLLVRSATTTGDSRPTVLTGFVLGLGVLVRPDLAVFSIGFFAALAVAEWSVSRRVAGDRLVAAALAGVALPLAYQIFRMGYFATLVPNTALAKEAGLSHWSQGWVYLGDFVGTYQLWVPLLPLLVWWSVLLAAPLRRRDAVLIAVLATPVASALVHAVYVVRVGGDFMHGRFLLPTLFALLLPLMLVELPLPRRAASPAWLALPAAAVVLVWATVAPTLRVAYWERISDDGLADERSVYTENSGRANPITLDDYLDMRQSWPRDGLAWQARAEQQARVLIVDAAEYPLLADVAPEAQVVVLGWNVGLAGFAAGIDVHVADRLGLADPIASRLRLERRTRPGHEKELPVVWAVARFSDATPPADAVSVAAAREAIECGELRAVLTAVTEPLSVERFLKNVRLSWTMRHLRVPADPQAARAELCGG
jgi:arabinofuranosyltransferase